MYEYKARIDRVVDGDTVDMTVDLGMFIYKKERMRLYGINTSEMNSKDPKERELAKQAKQYLIDRFSNVEYVTIHTIKDKSDKYGRLLCIIYIDNDNINDELIQAQLARKYLKL